MVDTSYQGYKPRPELLPIVRHHRPLDYAATSNDGLTADRSTQ